LSDKTLETWTSFSGDASSVYWLSNEIGRDEIITIANQTACRIDSIALHDDVQDTFDIEIYLQDEKQGKAYSITWCILTLFSSSLSAALSSSYAVTLKR
jgi:hypothetical protein